MYLRTALVPMLLAATAVSGAAAEESCGLRAVNLLAGGKTQELAAWFADPAQVLEPLQRMTESLGGVSGVQEVSGARFTQHLRRSVQAKNLQPSYRYQGYWINAQSERLGAVQFHIARAPEATCKLFAVHVDTAQ